MAFLSSLSLYITVLALGCLNAKILAKSMSSMYPLCPDHEKVALLQFKQSFRIDCSVSYDRLGYYTPYAKVKSWIGVDCCSWDGVECDKETGHVIGLDLSCSCLFGTFPSNSTLFNLVHLKKLRLPFNDFNYSHIPSELVQLRKLQFLDLFDSSFTGQIPREISELSFLSNLEIGDSALGGNSNIKLGDPSLGRLLQNLTRLEKLYLMNIDISSSIPIILRNLTSLRIIGLQYCNLYGELPSDLFHLPHLEMLDLNGNSNLEGSLPELQWHSPLHSISLSDTALSGEFPPSVGRLVRLELLDISGCRFSGTIPASLGNMTALTTLALNDNNFEGVVPSSITNLTMLEYLDLSNLNIMPGQLITHLPNLHGLTCLAIAGMNLDTHFPPFLANLTELAYLDLTKTHLVGRFPRWLSNLTQLIELGLAENWLEGPIPQWFSKLNNLEFLDLSNNNLFGNFETFSSLNNLHSLSLSGVNLTFLPHSRANSSLSQLKLIRLASCNLTEFPQFLRSQNQLQYIVLSGNNIKSSIPRWFLDTTKETLLALDLSDNSLTGFEQPVTVLPWTRLKILDLSGNELECPLPSPPATMKSYDASNNHITGTVPLHICHAKHLVSLDLSSNKLSGNIPICVGDQLGDSLEFLNLRGNNLNGTIPPALTTSCRLKMINLSENRFEGELPRSLVNCKALEVLDIGKNLVTDTFPSWLGSLSNLQVLVLRYNNFHGSILEWKSSTDFRVLRIIDLSHNLLTGPLPAGHIRNWRAMSISKEDQSDSSYTLIKFKLIVAAEVLYFPHTYEYSITITNKGSERLYSKILKVFRVIDFSCNKFTGNIPEVIGNLKGLQALNLSNNNLDGGIPPSLANVRDLESLDLSMNMLSGTIPLQLPQLTSLEAFNVSYNHLVGPIPQGEQFNTFDNSSYIGNLGLCGSQLLKRCGHIDPPPLPQMTSEESYDDSEMIDWVIRSLGCLSGFIIGFVIGNFYVTERYHEWFMEVFHRKQRRTIRRAPRNRR